jgi:osmotically-inducible protein OsmY
MEGVFEDGLLFQKSHEETVAARVHGVKNIINLIKVNVNPKYADYSLKARIEDRLASNWETSFVHDNIHVFVKNGKATLTGEVNTWAEYNEAGRLAFLTNGIWAVDNKLSVKGYKYKWDEFDTNPDIYNYNNDFPYPWYDRYFWSYPY